MKKILTTLIVSSILLGLSGCATPRRVHSVPVTTRTTTTTTTTDVSGNKTVVTEQQTTPQQVYIIREYQPYYGPSYYPSNWSVGVVFGGGGGGHGHRR